MGNPLKDFLTLYNGVKELKIRGGHEWYKIRAEEESPAEVTISIYDEISFWGITAQDFVDDLDRLPSSVNTINLRLNSPGGAVFDGLTISNRLREHSAAVHVTVDGIAASIASVIAMAGDTVTMGRGSQMMIHNPSALVLGQARDMREMADLLDKLARDSIASAYAAKSGTKADAWLGPMDVETWYSAAEAVKAGLADGTTDDPKPEPEDRATARVHSLTAHGWRYAGRAHAPNPADQDRSIRSRAAVARVRGLLEGVRNA